MKQDMSKAEWWIAERVGIPLFKRLTIFALWVLRPLARRVER